MDKERTDETMEQQTDGLTPEIRKPRRRRMDRYRDEESHLQPEQPLPDEESEETPEDNPETAEAQEAAETDAPKEKAEREAGLPLRSKLPEPARRMSENPYYGVMSPARVRQQARYGAARVSGADNGTSPAAGTVQVQAESIGSAGRKPASIRVGYASGRMSADAPQRRPVPEERISQAAGVQDPSGSPARQRGRQAAPSAGTMNPSGVPARQMGKRTVQPGRQSSGRAMKQKRPRRKKTWLKILILLILIAGAAAAAMHFLPEDNGIRRTVTGLVDQVIRRGSRTDTPENAAQQKVRSFAVSNNQGFVAPTDVTFSVTTAKSVSEIRLVDEDGAVIQTSSSFAGNAELNSWMLTLRVEEGYEGKATLQIREAEDWISTVYEVSIEVPGSQNTESTEPRKDVSDTETDTGDGTGEPEDTAETGDLPENGTGEDVPEELPEPEPVNESGESAESWEDLDPDPEEEPVQEDPEEIPEENPQDDPKEVPEEVPEEEPQEDPENIPEEESQENPEELPEEGPEETAPEEPSETGSEAAAETLPSEETDEAASEEGGLLTIAEEIPLSADPSLISSTVIYSGSKKVAEYNRAAKEQIHMPVGGEYTRKPMGVLTFRGDAFRQNAASGTVSGAEKMDVVWRVEAGSSRGTNQTYYGIGWTGQPAIVKWSKEVREMSNMFDAKQEISGLKEVIIAGLDGAIHFLDLADGGLTRNSIKLGYPMKGTPSVHPGGYPYMNVGQFARKMKVKTGKIGLRQYNLYTIKEMSLIDGLDGKMHRADNDVGSFETSALIDRTSDTMITAGTNGLLYLVSLGSNFDYVAGIYKQSASTVVMKSKAKTERKNAKLTAVEASVAMYDRYVYYADMGGILRCVDTNTLQTCWAVETGDAVESTPALDLTEGEGLALYTANTLHNRSKGAVEIRRYDAMSGREIWKTEIPVRKDSKTKEAVGAFASPVVGQNVISDLVYYTVTGLSDEGREMLGLRGEEMSALIALDKGTGSIRWILGLENECRSSPVAVYDESGNGWIIQCASEGEIYLLNGEDGSVVSTLTVEGTIEASPAVYNNMMVIGTTGKGTSYIYGISIQ